MLMKMQLQLEYYSCTNVLIIIFHDSQRFVHEFVYHLYMLHYANKLLKTTFNYFSLLRIYIYK
jgi:hypothetical protein